MRRKYNKKEMKGNLPPARKYDESTSSKSSLRQSSLAESGPTSPGYSHSKETRISKRLQVKRKLFYTEKGEDESASNKSSLQQSSIAESGQTITEHSDSERTHTRKRLKVKQELESTSNECSLLQSSIAESGPINAKDSDTGRTHTRKIKIEQELDTTSSEISLQQNSLVESGPTNAEHSDSERTHTRKRLKIKQELDSTSNESSLQQSSLAESGPSNAEHSYSERSHTSKRLKIGQDLDSTSGEISLQQSSLAESGPSNAEHSYSERTRTSKRLKIGQELDSTSGEISLQQSSLLESGPSNAEHSYYERTCSDKRLGAEEERGFRYSILKEMIEMNPNEVVMHLTSKMNEFISFLNMNCRSDVIMLVAALLAKACDTEMEERKAAFLAHSVRCNIMEKFSAFAFDVLALNLKYSKEELLSYFGNLQRFYQEIIDIIPNTALERLKEHSNKAFMAVQNLRGFKNISVPEDLGKKYDFLLSSINAFKSVEVDADSKKKRKREWQLGDDFREVSIYPLPQDLLRQTPIRLFPAVVEGPYKSVEHYLDIQFNLLRGDFLIPLRDGIADFIEQQSSGTSKFRRVENVRFYHGVRIQNQFIEDGTQVTEVLFDPRARLRQVKWKRSKRLLFGSLLCFTNDLFSSLFLGVIIERDLKLLEKGILKCKLIGDEDMGDILGKEFIMAESEVYFEAYQHVLKGLKNFNDRNFPLKEYIISVTPEAQLPSYLDRNHGAVYSMNGFNFPVVDIKNWPHFSELKVNESQFKALHSALTRKCAVIQGPPGTGKTYLGLMITKILLENSSHWRSVVKGPILVVCFTNHALDQFLEGILEFTKNVIRIGGQSKSDVLNEFNLKSFRRRNKIRSDALKTVEMSLGKCGIDLKSTSCIIKELKKDSGIFSLQILCQGMKKEHAAFFTTNGELDDDILIRWLLAGYYFYVYSGNRVNMNDSEPISNGMSELYAMSLQSLMNYITESGKEARVRKRKFYNKMQSLKRKFSYLKMKLMEKKEDDKYLLSQLDGTSDLNNLHPDLRWSLYNHWVSNMLKFYQQKSQNISSHYEQLSQQKLEILDCLNLEAMKRADVVGMTTTGAAKNQTLLQMLGCRIVIVEEAAEVLESHVIVSLSSRCEHLILIGDHKQLRPTTAVYKLAKDYHLDISLFERLLMNGVSFETLKIQHRMRPDIADLIIPAIYPLLENHPTVMNYNAIMGVRNNLFFINHTNFEETAIDELSKKNSHEAKFLIAFCRHLILQGYEPSQITILTTYLGQLFCLMEERERNNITKNVRVAVVDNYQGEENDIILLSLVRNNGEGKIGFLGIENRTCVALSRAKKGLFVMGNINMLAEKSNLWAQIKKVLEEKEAIGTHLILQCLKHPEQLTEVSEAEDFTGITEGGCTLICDQVMSCGHMCKKMCHAQGHDNFICQEICNKSMCINDHRCQKLCWESCGECKVMVEASLPCGHNAKLPCEKDPSEYKCIEMVRTKLPICDHKVVKLCHQDVTSIQCQFSCDARLSCGHACSKRCHVNKDPDHLHYKCFRPCARKNIGCQNDHTCQKKCFEKCGECNVKIKKKLPGCDHFYDMFCYENIEAIKCFRPCQKKLECGHNCPRRCKDICGGCMKMVVKEIPDCKHKVKIECYKSPVRNMCIYKCTRILSCGHNCTGICGDPCAADKCVSFSGKSAKALCGHDVTLFCSEVASVSAPNARSLMERCEANCNEVLMCSHKCQGTCGQCLQGRIHVPCQEHCGKTLICGHECTVSCSSACPPCKKKCFIRCGHTKCQYECGRPCPSCMEQCLWRCEHFKCGKKCSDICDRPPCNEPCKKKLKCGHLCIGFCGEKCPSLCKICNAEEVDEILDFFGTDANEDARFVMLPECGHVFESKGLDQWFSRSDNVIKMLQCPQCRIPVQTAFRYGNIAKLHYSNVSKVKLRIFGTTCDARNYLQQSLLKVRSFSVSKEFQTSRKYLEELLCLNRKNGSLAYNASFLNSLQVRTQCVLSIGEHFMELESRLNSKGRSYCVRLANQLVISMLNLKESISPQEKSDLEGECMRFHLMVQLRAVESTKRFGSLSEVNLSEDYNRCREVIENVKAFEKAKYTEVNQKMKDMYKILGHGQVFLSKTEMKQIASAVNLHQGHWILCPNGHVYVIADCGGAVTEGRCFECNERIGGTNHQLLSSNTRLTNLPEGL